MASMWSRVVNNMSVDLPLHVFPDPPTTKEAACADGLAFLMAGASGWRCGMGVLPFFSARTLLIRMSEGPCSPMQANLEFVLGGLFQGIPHHAVETWTWEWSAGFFLWPDLALRPPGPRDPHSACLVRAPLCSLAWKRRMLWKRTL